jgi:hypothetical protein
MKAKKKVSAVTKVSGNVQIISSPAMQKPLPEIEGAVTVSFKHEDEIHGMAIGPVIVTAVEPYEAWLKVHGIPQVNGRGETRYSYPFGSKPEGRHDLGWATKLVAREVAAHYGVALKES